MEHLQEIHRLQKLAGIKINEISNDINESEEDSIAKNALLKVLDKSKVKDKIDKNQIKQLDLNKEPEEVKNEESEVINESVVGTIATIITIAGLIPVVLEAIGGGINKAKQTFSLSDEEKNELKILNQKIEDAKKQKDHYDKKTGISTAFGIKPPKEGDKEDLIRYKKEKKAKKQENKWSEIIHSLKKEKDEKFGSKIGNKIKHFGHGFHSRYIKIISKLLKGIAWIAHISGAKNNVLYTKEETRKKLAEAIYLIIMISAAGVGLVSSHTVHVAISAINGKVSFGAVWAAIEALKSGKTTSEAIEIAAEKI